MEIPWKNIENTMEYMGKCMEYMEYYGILYIYIYFIYIYILYIYICVENTMENSKDLGTMGRLALNPMVYQYVLNPMATRVWGGKFWS